MGMTLRLAWRNIWRQPRRTWLTVSAIAFATVLLEFAVPLQLGGYDTMVEATLRVYTGHAQIQRPGYRDRPQIHNAIDGGDALAQRLRDANLFKAVAARASGFALVSSEKRSYAAQVVGVEPAFERGVSTVPGMIKHGRFLQSADAVEAVIGSALARNLKAGLGDELVMLGSGRDGSVAAVVVPVVGIFASGSQDMDRFFVEIPLALFQDVFSMGEATHAVAVVGDGLNMQAELLANLRRELAQTEGLAILGWEDLVPGLKEYIEADKVSGLIFMGLLVAVVVFSILNTFLMAVLERTKEFGLMLALGTRPARIAGVVMLESLLLTLIGLVIGFAIGFALVAYFQAHGFSYPGLEEIAKHYNLPIDRVFPKVDLYTVAFGPAVILITTNLVAWIPVLRIRRLQPVEAMRTI